MTWLVLALLTLGAALLQTVFPAYAVIAQARFPFLLGVVVYYALHRDGGTMAVAAVTCGVTQDALSNVPLGYSAVLFLLVGIVTGRFRALVVHDSVVPSAFFCMAGSAAATAALFLLLLRGGLVEAGVPRGMWKAFGVGLLGTVAGPVMAELGVALDSFAGNVAFKENVTGIE